METQKKQETLLEEVITHDREIILYNDDVNTFEHVIDCLISICDHSKNQAEQCAYIVHYKGKCSIKKGSVEQLEPMLIALQMQDLSAKLK